MGWIRKKILQIVVRAIKENGLQIGDYLIVEEDGALTVKRV